MFGFARSLHIMINARVVCGEVLAGPEIPRDGCVYVFVCVCVCVWGGGGKGRGLYLTLHCHHQNDFCTKVGSDVHKSHFNASFIAVGKVARQCPQTTTFGEKGEPKQGQNRTHVIRLPA